MSRTTPGFGNYAKGPRHPNWTGDAVTYRALHTWVSKHKTKPDACTHCGRTDKPLDWANVSHEYRRDLDDWIALCRKCHRAYDYASSSVCRNGHPRTSENVLMDGGSHRCRQCKNENWRRRYYEKEGRVVPT